MKFDEFPANNQDVHVKRRNITTVVDRFKEEKEFYREVEEFATIDDDKKYNNTQLRSQK